MYPRVLQVLKSSLVASFVLTLGMACSAQATRPATDIPDSRVDFYGGYGYFHPIDSQINGYSYQDIYNFNATSNLSAYFNHYIGVQLEASYFSGNSPRGEFGQCRSGACNDRDPIVYTGQIGPVARFPMGRWIPYAHVLGGGARVNGPILQKLTWGWGLTAGGGIDYVMPYFHNRFSIRPIQADFQYSHVDYGPLLLPAGLEGGLGEVTALKLSAGVVARFGVPSVTRPVEFACTTQPGSVFPGEPVAANGSTANLPVKKTPVYTWTASGGRLTFNGTSASIDTTSLAPGDYTVAGHLSYGKKATEQASCTAPFVVKAFEPPTISCSANPSTVTSGTSVDISTSGMSPQNRPLTYSYSASAGQIVSSGPTAKLTTAGLSASTITVTCNLVDDLGRTASATTTVTVQSLPTPVEAHSMPLCSMAFTRDHARPARVDNEAKGCLDDVFLTLNKRSDSQLYIIGEAVAGEPSQIAAERALNVRQYLVQEKGVDPSRIYLRTGGTPGKTVSTVLVPAGATFTDTTAQTFDEGSIKRHGQAYGPNRGAGTKPAPVHHRRKKAAPAPPPQ